MLEFYQMKEYQPIPQNTEKVGKACLNAAYKVHNALGPGLLESVYHKAMLYEITKQNLNTQSQAPITIAYDNQNLGTGFFCDILVDDCVILELKSVEKMIPLYQAQLLTYLKLAHIRLGYLINFNVPHLKDGIKRMVL
jgi:GxxExxY protein